MYVFRLVEVVILFIFHCTYILLEKLLQLRTEEDIKKT